MYTKASLFAVGLLAGTTLSAPSSPNSKRGVSVPVRRVRSLARRDGNSSPATDHVVVDFTFGGQQIPVALDSGSTFTYVASTLDTNTAETSSLPALFNPNISSTYHDENDPGDAYNCGGDSVTCVLGLDDVSTAGLTAEQMTFGVASHVAEGVFASGQAATMGFGRQAGDPTTWLPRDQTFWYRAGASLPSPYLFTVDIYEDRNGTFDFGFIDGSKYQGDITYADINTDRSNWNFNLTGFAIGNENIQQATEFTALVDTGGPNIGLPAEITNAYFNSIGGSPSPGNSHTYPCSAYPPPDLTLQLVNGGTIVLNGTFLVEPPNGKTGTCNGRLDDSVQTAYNLGASVLDQKFVVFDHANQRIGFADKASFSKSGMQTGSSSGSTTRLEPASPRPATATTITTTGTRRTLFPHTTESSSQNLADKSAVFGGYESWWAGLLSLAALYL